MEPQNLNSGASELKEYLGIVWRHRWLVIVAVVIITAVAVGSTILFSTPKYQASTDLLQRRSGIDRALLGSDIFGDSTSQPERTLDTAAELVKSPQVVQFVAASLGDKVGNRSLENMIDVSIVKQTDIFRVTATDTDPQMAADVANAFAAAYIGWRQQVDKDAIAQARLPIEAQLKEIPADQADSAIYKSLNDKLETLKIVESMQTTSQEVVKPATPVLSPVSPKPVRTGVVAAIISMVVGVGAVFTVDKLDTKVRTTDEVIGKFDKPILASIPRLPSGDNMMVTLEHPSSSSSEAFRLLKTNLGYVKPDSEVKSIMITSSEPSEGKTTTIANLAVTMARSGIRVIVIECDLRRPRLALYAGLDNAVGLTNAISGNCSLRESLQMIEAKDLAIESKDIIDPVMAGLPEPCMNGVKPIYFATSGPLPPNPGELVASDKLGSLIAEAREYADIVLVDAPPLGVVGDAASLAGKVDGIVMIVKLAQTAKKSMTVMQDFIDTVPCDVLGIVVTNCNAGSSYGKGYGYYEYGEYS